MDVHNFSCFVILFGTLLAISSHAKQYRNDYVYNTKTDAFYKFHVEEKRGWEIKGICETEGALPMVPASFLDIAQVHEMFKQYPDIGMYVWVGSDGKEHEEAEHPLIELNQMDGEENSRICEVLTRNGKIESLTCSTMLPFICKVTAEDAIYDSHCRVFGANYIHYQSVGSCYKIPRIVYSWNQAYTECQAEGAHLVVLNSVAEHDAVKNLTNSVSKVPNAKTSYFFFAGFRADVPVGNTTRVFRTIFNTTLEEAGYSNWSPNEPNNYLDSEYCGSIFKNDGDFNDVDCSHEYAFICEKEVQ